jgi:hypothetical protein
VHPVPVLRWKLRGVMIYIFTYCRDLFHNTCFLQVRPFFKYSGGWSQLSPLGTAATTGLLCQSRAIMIMKNLVEWLAGESEVLGENLPQCRFVHHKPHMLSGSEPGPARWEASD